MDTILPYFQWITLSFVLMTAATLLFVWNNVPKPGQLDFLASERGPGVYTQATHLPLTKYIRPFSVKLPVIKNGDNPITINVRSEQKDIEITEAIFHVLEKERNEIGMELHDNVNQILVGTKILLCIIRSEPPKARDFLDECIDNIDSAIEENRKIAHRLVAPDQDIENLLEQVDRLSASMFRQAGIKVIILAKGFTEKLLDSDQKLAVYRILQEQFTNIIKYAYAKTVAVFLNTGEKKFNLRIVDDGRGVGKSDPIDGIGLKNIAGRLKILNGTMKIDTDAGDGFMLEVQLPLK